MSNNSKSGQQGDLIYWLIAIGLLFTGIAAPVGVVMIVLKLMGGKKKGRHPYYMQRDGETPTGARTTAPPREEEDGQKKRTGGRKKRGSVPQDQLAQMAKSAKGMTTGGAALSAAFGCMAVINAADSLWMLPDVLWYLEEIIPLLCFTAVGLGVLGAGLLKRRAVHRYRSYLAMIGSHKAVSVSALSSATGSSPAKVRDDLEDMLEENLFPNGYLDLGSGMLVISGDGLSDSPKEEAKQAQPPKEERPQDAVLDEIRTVNDAIDNPRLSQQIDRIGVITAKILDYQRQHPDKSPQLHSFLSYYLPTTLKILRAYAQLEDQEVAGENITAAMQRIEGMMDKVVEGFEKQLDQLFQGDAMDITTDVEVLERMLDKDGLGGTGMTLGG